MPEVVDPDPLIKARLLAIAAEHEPRIEAPVRSLADATSKESRELKKELRRVKRAYAAARRDVAKLRGPGVAW